MFLLFKYLRTSKLKLGSFESLNRRFPLLIKLVRSYHSALSGWMNLSDPELPNTGLITCNLTPAFPDDSEKFPQSVEKAGYKPPPLSRIKILCFAP
jgi:hypothetical protein